MLSANSDEHVEVAEEIGHDRGERCVLVGGPYTSVSVDIERDGYGAARRYVAACKVKAAEIQREMAFKATHIHGALGTTNTLPITRATDWLGIAAMSAVTVNR